MTFRGYYDPHYKRDRTPADYERDKRRDAIGAMEAAAFVAEFLANHRPKSSGSTDPAAVFKALRTEARRLRSTRRNRPGSRGKIKSKAKRDKRRNKLGEGPKPALQRPSHPWLKRKSSLNYLRLSDGELLTSYFETVEKIDAWRTQRAQTADQKRKAALAEQVQIQLEKRGDLLALIFDRAIGDEVQVEPFSAKREST